MPTVPSINNPNSVAFSAELPDVNVVPLVPPVSPSFEIEELNADAPQTMATPETIIEEE